MLIARDHHVAR